MFKNLNILLVTVIFLLGIFFIPGLVAAAGSEAVYVNTHGNDSWDGLSATYNNISNSGPKATIKNATSTVSTNGTVHIASGTYYENQINITKNMNIIGAGRNSTIINGTYSGNIFNIISGVTVSIESLTLTNGNATRYQTPRPPYPRDVVVSYGGAINNRGMLTIKNSLFKNNGELGNGDPEPGELQVWTYGGAIYNYFGGTLFVDNCEFVNNTAFYGGSINNNGTLTVKNSVFTSSNVTTRGNGAVILNTGTATVNYSLISNNAASNGAIYNDGNLTVFSSTFINNTAYSGGAIFSQGYLKVTNSTFINNTSSYYSGGAIYAYDDSIVNFNRFIGNSAVSGIGNIITVEGNMDARWNWWGSNSPNLDRTDFYIGPGLFVYDPWIVLTVSVSPLNVRLGGSSNVTADLLHDNQGNLHGTVDGFVPYSGPANFKTDDGIIVDAFFVDGVARTTLSVGDALGLINVSAVVDGQIVKQSVYVGLANVNPANGTFATKNQDVIVSFTEAIVQGPGYSNIRVIDGRGNEKSISLTINGNQLFISLVGGWSSGGTYTLLLPDNAVTSAGGIQVTLSLNSTFFVYADVVYVSKQGNDRWDGLSPVYNNSTGSGPKATVKEAVRVLVVNGIIHIASGTYYENNIKITKDMTIIGAGRDNTTINGNNGGPIMDIAQVASVTISNLTFTNGRGSVNGGAIYNAGTLTLNNTVFRDNEVQSRSGGAIYNTGTLSVYNSIFRDNVAITGSGGAITSVGTLYVFNSVFTNNTALNRSGGAIYNQGNATVTNSTFSNNLAGNGGAIYNRGKLIINSSSFTGNYVDSYSGNGGAITNQGVLTINDSIFTNNTGVVGGAIASMIEMTINNSTFTGNTASNGGAVYNGGSLKLKDSNFMGNTATDSGGAISNTYGDLIMTGSVFHGNYAVNEGGVISNYLSNLTIISSIFTNNTSREAGVLHNAGGQVTIAKSTFTGNAAIGPGPWGRGGVIFNQMALDATMTGIRGMITITDSILSGNTALRAAGIYNAYAELTVIGSVISNNIARSPYNIASYTYGGAIYNERGEVLLSFNWITNNGGSYEVFSEVSSVYADNNWWGSNDGTNKVSINGRGVNTWLVVTVSLTDNIVNLGDSINAVVNMWYNNWGEYLDPTNGHVPDGIEVDLSSLLGHFLDSTVKLVNGMAETMFTPDILDSGKISVSVNGQTIMEIIVHVLDKFDLSSLNSTELQELRDAFNISRETGLQWIADYQANMNNTQNNNTPENNTNTPTNSSSDENTGGITPGTGDGSPQGNNGLSPNVPQEPNSGQNPDTAQSASGQSQEESQEGSSGASEEMSVGESGQNPKTYEISQKTTANSGTPNDTILFAVLGVFLLLILVGVGYYFKK